MTLSKQLEDQIDQMSNKIQTLMSDLQNPTDKDQHIMMFILSNVAKQIFTIEFLTDQSKTLQGLPYIYQNKLKDICKQKSIDVPIILAREQIINILDDFNNYIKKTANNNTSLDDYESKKEIEDVQDANELLFHRLEDVTSAFQQLKLFYKYNNIMSGALNEFKEYVDDANNEQYDLVCQTLHSLDDQLEEASMEDSLSNISNLSNGLPQFDDLDDVIAGKSSLNHLNKYFCLESATALGNEAMGPLPLLLRIQDIEQYDNLEDLDNMGDKTNKIVQNLNDYFPQKDNRRLTSKEVLEGYASTFLKFLGLGKQKDIIKVFNDNVGEICTIYNKKNINSEQIIKEQLSENKITIMEQFFRNILNESKAQQQKNIEQTKKVEARKQEIYDQRIKDIIQAGTNFIQYIETWISQRCLKDNN